jgi:quercetin dioxygenase-like cupin family protein
MEVKYNEATRNRPEGDRPLDAPVVLADIPSYIKQLKNEKAWEEGDRNSITLFKSGGMRVVLVCMHKHTEMTTERPENILNIYVLDGRLQLDADKRSVEVDQEQLVALHENIQYKITAVKKSTFLLTVLDR